MSSLLRLSLATSASAARRSLTSRNVTTAPRSLQDYRLVKELWAFTDHHIAVRFQYEWHNDAGQWFRSYGNELWEFDENGLMRRREASINDVAIAESDRKFFWPAPGARPLEHPGIPDVQ